MNKEVDVKGAKEFVKNARNKDIPEVHILKSVCVSIGNTRKSLYSLTL
jgi:hypothetical protein